MLQQGLTPQRDCSRERFPAHKPDAPKARRSLPVDIDLAIGVVTVESAGRIEPIAFAAPVDEAGYEVAL